MNAQIYRYIPKDFRAQRDKYIAEVMAKSALIAKSSIDVSLRTFPDKMYGGKVYGNSIRSVADGLVSYE